MPTTLTEYYDLEKPELEASSDDWGRILNESLDKIDAAIRNTLHANSHPAFNTPLTANVCNIPTYFPDQLDVTSAPTNSRLAATQGWVEGRILFYLNKFLPVGSIMLWSGAFGTVPAGWTFCDGTAGSPDLRARFILCANNTAPIHAPWAAAGHLTAYPGEHVHQLSYNFYPGPVAGDPIPVSDGAALYSGDNPVLPYFVLMYIYKYAAW